MVGSDDVGKVSNHCVFYVYASLSVAYTYDVSYNEPRRFVNQANEKSGGYHGPQTK